LILPIYADVVWPALLLEQRLIGVIPITVGLIVEWLALWLGGFGLSWKKAALVDVAMNAVSTVAGVVLIPAAGFVWEFFPGTALSKIFNAGTFNHATWAYTFVIAVLVTTAIEAAVVRFGFKVTMTKRRFGILCLANCASVAIAFASIWIHPAKM
jgi:hypothetical protein